MQLTYQCQGQMSRSPLMLTLIVHHIFWTARPMNFKLGIRMEDDDPHQPRAPWPPRSRSQSHVISLSRLGQMLYLYHQMPGGIQCRPNPAARLLATKIIGSQSIRQSRCTGTHASQCSLHWFTVYIVVMQERSIGRHSGSYSHSTGNERFCLSSACFGTWRQQDLFLYFSRRHFVTVLMTSDITELLPKYMFMSRL